MSRRYAVQTKPTPAATGAGGGGGGGTNNAAIVAGHLGGDSSGTTTPSTNFGGNTLTSGNVILLGAISYGSNAHTFAITDISKTAGTATIGTVVLDQAKDQLAGDVGVALFRIPITATGTLTIAASCGSNNSALGAVEVTGLNVSPLGPHSTATGTGTDHSTGSVATTTKGLMLYVASENAFGDFTRISSDQVIFHEDRASSQLTCVVQYKIVNSSPTTMTDTTQTDSGLWYVAYAEYLTS